MSGAVESCFKTMERPRRRSSEACPTVDASKDSGVPGVG